MVIFQLERYNVSTATTRDDEKLGEVGLLERICLYSKLKLETCYIHTCFNFSAYKLFAFRSSDIPYIFNPNI